MKIDPYSIKCPCCGAPPYKECYGNGPMREPHQERHDAALRKNITFRDQRIAELESEIERMRGEDFDASFEEKMKAWWVRAGEEALAENERLAGMVEAQQRFIEKWGIGKTFGEITDEIEAERAVLEAKKDEAKSKIETALGCAIGSNEHLGSLVFDQIDIQRLNEAIELLSLED